MKKMLVLALVFSMWSFAVQDSELSVVQSHCEGHGGATMDKVVTWKVKGIVRGVYVTTYCKDGIRTARWM